ncbi:MAG: TrkA family potassium uptake protein [Bacteroidetes bacterium]|nr:TrkA family potassium uptake protein [Bacteroidota bacterium]
MKFIVIGLGNFGSSLAEKLTEAGNEVIGVDSNFQRVELFKEKITYTICLDATNPESVKTLPLKDTDLVIIAIGEDKGSNIIASAVMKNLHVKRLISRALDATHENVLSAMGITEIANPELETAEKWAKKLSFTSLLDSYELTSDFSIVEVKVPDSFFGKTLDEIGFQRNYNLLVLTTIREERKESFIGINKTVKQVQGVSSPDTVLQKGEIMVIYGHNSDIKNLLRLEQ